MHTHEKHPFDMELAMERIREAVRPYPKAAMFELRDDGFDSPFEQLLACLLSVRVRDEYASALPCDAAVMQSFAGIGPKCTNLALGIACGQQRISVDIHVHRVANRWGYVSTSTPEQTMAALEKMLPPKYWVEINERLVPFGKHICTGARPKCSTCPVREMCQQVGVTSHR